MYISIVQIITEVILYNVTIFHVH